MKFHGITMVGPFVNQKLSVIPVFDPTRDQGRLVWLIDGTLWYGSDTEWVNFSSGAGDANEVEDMYSDLLRTTIFLNASYDEFADEDMVLSTNMSFDQKEKVYEYSMGQYTESINLYDSESLASYVDYVLPSVDYIDTTQPLIEVSSNGGTDWFTVENNKIFRIPPENAGVDLRIRFTGGGTGILKSWGILYNKDLSAGCTKWGLTYKNMVATTGQTLFEVDYQVGAIQVFLNGRLLDDSDFTATTGTEVVLDTPATAGDNVYVLSYSTSILNPNVDFDSFIKRDGTVEFMADQSMGGYKIVDMAEGTDPTDAVTFSQLQDSGGDLATDIATNTTNIGINTTAIGVNTTNIGNNTTAIGVNTTNIGNNTTAIGVNTTNIGNNTTAIGINTTNIGANLTAIGTNTTAIGINSTAIGSNTSDIADLQDVVGASQQIIGGDITLAGNDITVTPVNCIDSTHTVALETLSDVSIYIPNTYYDHVHHIYIVRLVSTGLCTIKSYPNEVDVQTDTTIDAYRWLDFWNTDQYGDCAYSRTFDGVKYFGDVYSLTIISGFDQELWISLDLSAIVPVDKISKWLPGATWVGTNNLTSNSTTLSITSNVMTEQCSLYNYDNDKTNRFWGSSSLSGVSQWFGPNVELPPIDVWVKMTLSGATTDNTWAVSFQKIYLRR